MPESKNANIGLNLFQRKKGAKEGVEHDRTKTYSY
jgi:hypothetical protein